jgi:hypothetical protein
VLLIGDLDKWLSIINSLDDSSDKSLVLIHGVVLVGGDDGDSGELVASDNYLRGISSL